LLVRIREAALVSRHQPERKRLSMSVIDSPLTGELSARSESATRIVRMLAPLR